MFIQRYEKVSAIVRVARKIAEPHPIFYKDSKNNVFR